MAKTLPKLRTGLCLVFLLLCAARASAQTYNITICSGETLNFTPTSLGPPSTETYRWPLPSQTAFTDATAQNTYQTSVNQTITNSSNVARQVTYAVQSFSGVYNFTLVVTVNPTPTFTSSLSTTSICSGGTFSFNTSSPVAGTTATWTRSVTSNITPSSSSGAGSIIETLTNTSINPAIATYTISLTSTGCGNTQNVSVIVNPLPTINNTAPNSVCSGVLFTYAASSGQSPVNFTWQRPIVGGITNTTGTGSSNSVNETLVNSTTAPVSVNYDFTLTNGTTGCSNTETVTVSVVPTPTLTSATTVTVCSGSVLVYNPTSSLAGSSFDWTRAATPNITPNSSFGNGSVNETLVNTGTTAASPSYVYNVTKAGCSSTQTVTATVNPLPALSSTVTPPALCSGTAFNYTPASIQDPNVNYSWVRNTQAGISNSGTSNTTPISETLINTTNATISVLYTYTLTNSLTGCINTQNLFIDINPIPTVSSYTLSVCNNNGFASAPAGAAPGTTFTWVTPTMTPAGVVTSDIAGVTALTSQTAPQLFVNQALLHNTTGAPVDVTYTVKPNLAGCIGSDFTVIVNVLNTVTPVDISSNSLSVTPFCSNIPSNFNYNVATSSMPATFSWQRSFVAGITNSANSGSNISAPNSIVETLVNNTTADVTTYYAITIKETASGCTNGFIVSAPVKPVASMTSSLTPVAICSNTVFNYTPTADVPSTTFSWSRPSVTGISPGTTFGSSGNPAETLVNSTTAPISVSYVYTLTTPGSCTSNATVVLSVNPAPTLSSPITSTGVCSNSAFSYTATSATTGTVFSWSRPLAANISNGAATGVNNLINETLINSSSTVATAVYNFSLLANGCTNAQTVTIPINPIPSITNKSDVICTNTSFSITPSGVGVPAGTQYSWAAPVSVAAGVVTGGLTATLQNSISQTLQNTTTAPGILYYTVTPVANGCAGLDFTVDVTVNPKPVISTPVTIPAVCSGSAFTYTPPSVPATTAYTWSAPTYSPLGGLTGGGALSNQPVVSQTLVSTGTVAATASYTIIPVAAGCVGNTFTLNVPVNPVPIVSSPVNTAVCSGNAFSTTITGVPSGTTYTWTTPAVTPFGSVTGESAQATPVSTISQTITNNTSSAATTLYTIIPVSATCTGGAFSLNVTINPSTQLSSSLTPAAICSAGTFSYAPTSATSGTSFSWTRAVVAGISNGVATGINNPLEVLTNVTAAPITVTYVYALSTAAGCTNSQTVTVVANPTPKMSISLTPADVCSGNLFSYTPVSATAGTNFSWNRQAITNITNAAANSNGAVNETLVNASLAPIQVLYDYTLLANGCSNTETVRVNINPVPVVNSQALSICSNTSFTVAPANVPSNTLYTWGTPTSNPVNVVNNGSAQATPQPTISQLLFNNTTAPGNLVYAAIPAASGCAGQPFTITVTVNPVPNAGNATLAAVCSGSPFTYTPAGLPSGTVFSWSSPAISPAGGLTGGSAAALKTSVSQTLVSNNNIANNAVYTVTPLANGCTGSTFQVTVPVNPVPVVNNQTLAICSGNAFTVTPTSVPVGTRYTWITPTDTPFGSVTGSSSQVTPQSSISQVLTNTTTAAVQTLYTVTPSVNGCTGNDFTITVGINPGTQLNISTTAPAVCSNTQFSYAAASNTPGTSFQWTRAVVAGISNVARAGTNNPLETLVNITTQAITVTYAYTLTTPAGCTNNETVSVRVNPTPSLTSLLNPAAICSGAQFNYNPTAALTGTSFAWTRAAVAFISNTAASGTNNPAELLVNTSVNTVNTYYDYTMTANGCTNTERITVTVNPTPTIANQTTATCSNVAFNYSPANVPAGTLYTWTSPTINPLGSISGGTAEPGGQPSVAQLLINQTLNTAIARYRVTPVAGACTGADFFVEVTLNPAASISNQILAAICSGTTFTYTPSNVPANTVYTWSNPAVSPAGGLTGGSAEAIAKTSISQTLSSSNNVVNNAVYTVTPSTNGCLGQTFNLSVFVNPTPSVTNMKDTICTGSSFSLTAASPVPSNTLYTWATPLTFPFGSIVGGTAQPSPAPTISQTLFNTTTAPAQAVYTVTPQAGGCVGNTFTLNVVVGAVLPAIPNQAATVCSGAAFNATPGNQPPNTTYTWGTPGVAPTGSVTGISAASTPQAAVSQVLDNLITTNSTVVYTVTAKNSGCISNSFTATITVLPVPRTFVTGKPEICRYPFDTLSVSFTGSSPWGFTYFDGTTNTPHVITGITTTPYQLVVPSSPNASRKLSFLNASHNGCTNVKDTVYFSQVINSLPVGVIHSLHGPYICNDIADTMFVTSPEVLTYQWTRNGTVINGATDDSIATNFPGRYNVQLVNQFGCRDTAAVFQPKIYIPQPVLRLLYDTYCINVQMNITNITDTNLIGPTMWQWTFDNGASVSSQTGFHSNVTFTTGGDHHIRLKATQFYCPANPTTFDTTINIRFPIAGVTMPSISAYKGQSTPVAVRSLPGYKYRWTPPFGINNPDSASTFFNNQNTQQYVINLISPAGCVTNDSLLIRVFDDKLVEILIPKSFTPNGDGINDILYPYLSGIKEFKYFRIYNRFNQLMFETKNHDVGWNGTLNGTPQPMAIYIWVAVGIGLDGSTVERKGQVLLLR